MTFDEYIQSVKNKKLAFLGAGVSNMPLLRLFAKEGADITVRDRASAEKLGNTYNELVSLGAKLCLGDSYLSNINEEIIFRSPGIRPDAPELLEAVSKGSIITSEMEAFFEVCPCKMIAVTGSDGKTTTTTMIAELLKAAGKTVHVGGNIGTPLLCKTPDISPDDIVVLELSSFQLMTMKKSPHIAVITNLAPNHLDIHKDMAEYVDAKKNIFMYQTGADKLILNYDNEITHSFAKEAKGELAYFSRDPEIQNGVMLDGGEIFAVTSGKVQKLIDKSDILLKGEHNVDNYMAAFAAVYGVVSADDMKRTARTFGGVEHRLELVRTHKGISYYNDSIASSPSRTTAGLRSFDEKIVLIAGGKDKGVPFDGLGTEIIEHVKKLVLTGFTAEKIRDAVVNSPKYKGEPEIFVIDDFKEAVIKASEIAEPGDNVVLSPACTSFDKFKNFVERGNYFKEIVNGLE